MDNLQLKIYNELKDSFNNCPEVYAPYFFVGVDLPFDRASFKRELQRCKKNNIFCVIPELHFDKDSIDPSIIAGAYKEMLSLASATGMTLVFDLDPRFEEIILRQNAEYNGKLRSRLLVMHKYRCFECETVRYNTHSGTLMSIVAFGENTKIIDLRDKVDDGVLRWDVPRGNWDILEFSCIEDEDSKKIDYLNYKVSLSYVHTAFSTFSGFDEEDAQDTLSAIKYSDVAFAGRNRRMWSEKFNEIFEKKYGFDPAPFYPALYFDVGPCTARLKAQFMDCRAEMLKNGFIKAAYDYASERNTECIGGLSEPKLTACSQTIGDALLANSYAPSATMDKAYMYGINSVKIAAGSAYSFDRTTVSCDMFRDYAKKDVDIAVKDVMHALARGANSLMIHSFLSENDQHAGIVKFLFGGDSYTELMRSISRIQALLRGGKHVSDIAMLYPIYSLHSSVFFYDYDTNGYEYPSTPADADYMNVINSISLYSGHDVTVLHPDTLNEKCHVNDGRLYLDNVVNKEKYSILVLPATKVISIRSLELIAEFFDCGGKIIATGVLPSHAIESTAENNLDGRVRELVSHIFGKDADDSSIMRSYCLNTNINGGMAYMLYFSFTAADGTNMTDSASLRSALESFGVVFDIELEDAVKYEATGALNTIYPVFKMLGLASHLPNGGTVSHIHKRHGEIDVYYIANTTNLNISTKMTVAGEMLLEDWDPHTGRIKRLPCTHSERGGTKLTSAQLELPAAHSLLLVGTSVNI